MDIQIMDILDAIDETARARSLCKALFLALDGGLTVEQGEPYGQLLAEIRSHIDGAHRLLSKYDGGEIEP